MLFKCNCGRKKSGQPFKAMGVRLWICPSCHIKTKTIFVRSTRLVLIRRLDFVIKQQPRRRIING